MFTNGGLPRVCLIVSFHTIDQMYLNYNITHCHPIFTPTYLHQRAIEEQMVQTELASLDIDTLPLMQALLRAINDANHMEQNGYFASMVDQLTDSHHSGTPNIAEFTQMITGSYTLI